jgi:hypothetical protein
MKKFIKAAVVAAYALPLAAFASNIDANTFTKNNLANFINGMAAWFAGIIFAISVLIILYAAFLFVTAAGNEDKVTKAKSTIVYGLIGIAVAMLAFGVREILVSFLS